MEEYDTRRISLTCVLALVPVVGLSCRLAFATCSSSSSSTTIGVGRSLMAVQSEHRCMGRRGKAGTVWMMIMIHIRGSGRGLALCMVGRSGGIRVHIRS